MSRNRGDRQDTRAGTYVDRQGRVREVRIEQLDPALVEAYRRLTPGERIEIGLRHSAFLVRQAQAFVQAQHPDWSAEEVRAELVRRARGRGR